MTTLTGSCVCGEVEFCVDDQFAYSGYCHCSLCRKASGGAGTAIGGIANEHFTVTKGQHRINYFNRSKDTISAFCSVCGSTLFGEKPLLGMVHIRYGSLDQTPSLLPQAHMHVSSKADWYEINDSLPQFSEFPVI
jgi:hypothetical protein